MPPTSRRSFIWLYRKNWTTLLALSVLMAIQSLLYAADPIILRYTLDEGLGAKRAGAVWVGVIAFVALVAVRTVGEGAAHVGRGLARLRLARDLRGTFARAVLEGDPGRVRTLETGDLVTRMTQDAKLVEDFLSDTVPEGIHDLVMVIVCVAIMVWLDWRLAALVVALTPIQPFLFKLVSGRLDRAAEEERRADSAFFVSVTQVIRGSQTIRALGAGPAFLKRFHASLDRLTRATTRLATLQFVGPGATDVFAAFVQFGLVFGLGGALAFSDHLTIGDVMAFYMYSNRLVRPIVLATRHLAKLRVTRVAMARIDEVVTQVALRVEAGVRTETPGPRGAATCPAALRLSGVTYTYPDSDQTAIRNVSLSVAPGEKIALVGPNGSGKTTAALILAGLLTASSGEIETGGCLYVGREPFLMAGTIRENLEFGDVFDDEALWAALKVARADDFVSSLPGGLGASIAEGGASLSAGEQQKLALARAVLRHPRFLILDEAISSVDAASREGFIGWLRGQPVGIVLITHDSGGADWVDRVYRMDQGYVFPLQPAEPPKTGGDIHGHLQSLG